MRGQRGSEPHGSAVISPASLVPRRGRRFGRPLQGRRSVKWRSVFDKPTPAAILNGAWIGGYLRTPLSSSSEGTMRSAVSSFAPEGSKARRSFWEVFRSGTDCVLNSGGKTTRGFRGDFSSWGWLIHIRGFELTGFNHRLVTTMWTSAQYWPMLALVVFATFYLWRRAPLFSWSSTGVLARASFEVGLSLPVSPLRLSQRFINKTGRVRHEGRGTSRSRRQPISRYMLRLYHRRPDADIVRALQPVHISCPLSNDGGRILEFSMPVTRPDEVLEAAELLGAAGMILRVHSVDESPWGSQLQRPRRDDAWRGFNVTAAVLGRIGEIVRLRVRGRVDGRHRGEGPILLLSYSKPKKRKPRSIPVDEEQSDAVTAWKNDASRRRRRNACRKRPLYVDFSTISYDEWVVAPKGYDAYQCVGKCFYPLSEHLSPTKHAIVQTLVYTALQAADEANPNPSPNPNPNPNAKPAGRACCVPTRLTATSLLYMDASGTLTYQYGYEDMVVAECGCR